jgi:hypothetical protein
MRRTQVEGSSFDEWEEPDGSGIHGLGHHQIDAESLRKDIAVYFG